MISRAVSDTQVTPARKMCDNPTRRNHLRLFSVTLLGVIAGLTDATHIGYPPNPDATLPWVKYTEYTAQPHGLCKAVVSPKRLRSVRGTCKREIFGVYTLTESIIWWQSETDETDHRRERAKDTAVSLPSIPETHNQLLSMAKAWN